MAHRPRLEIAWQDAAFAAIGGLPQTLASGSLSAVRIWITPNRPASDAARRRLASAGPGALAVAVATLRQTADSLAARSAAARRPLTRLQQTELIAGLIDRLTAAGRLQHFAGARPVRRVAQQVAAAFGQIADSPAGWSPTGDPAERDLAILYRAYRGELSKAGLIDEQGRAEQAIAVLGEAGAEQPGIVLVTGHDRFPPLERRLLAALGGAHERVVVVLPTIAGRRDDEPAPSGIELPGPLAAVEREAAALAEHFPETTIHERPPAEAIPADPDHRRVHHWLFRNPRLAPDAEGRRGPSLRLMPADSPREELAAVAARVKQLLISGVAAERIVLATRRPSDVAPLSEHAFHAAGVPLAIERSRRPVEAPLFRVLHSVVDLAAGDWPRAELLRLATSPALTTVERPPRLDPDRRRRLYEVGFAGPRAAAEHALREQLLQSGKAAWLETLAWQATPPEEEPSDGDTGKISQRLQRRQLAAEAAMAWLGPLAEQLDAWAEPAAPIAWYDRLRSIAAWLGYRAGDDPAAATLDTAVLPCLEAALAGIDRLASWRNSREGRLDLSEVAALMAWWGEEAPLDTPAEDEGRVRLLRAESAATLEADHLFLVGMGEAAFPGPPPAPPIARLGPSLAEHYSREMLLFHRLATGVAPRVTFSYPSIDAKCQPLLASSYVAELDRLLPPAAGDQEAASNPTTHSELRIEAVRELNDGRPATLARVLGTGRPGADTLAARLAVTLGRAAGDGFGPAEGVLEPGAATGKIGEHFGAEHRWSPTQLETYAECPFKFFMGSVLGVRPIDEAELGVDYRRRGSLLHDAMALLHTRLHNDGVALRDAITDPDRFLDAYHQAIDAAAATPRQADDATLAKIERLQAESWAATYREQLDNYINGRAASGAAVQPAYFEARFGSDRVAPDGGTAELEASKLDTTEPFALRLTGETILLTGQVDRIDVGQIGEQVVFNVIDYKTAKKVSAPLAKLRDGRQLQLLLYALAISEHLLPGAVPWRLGYWEVRDRGFCQPSDRRTPLVPAEQREGAVVATDAWTECGDVVRERIAQIVGGVRRGEFPMHNPDENCGQTCDYRTVCRVAQARSLGKQPPPPAAAEPDTGSPRE